MSVGNVTTSSAETLNQRWVIGWRHKCTLTANNLGPSKQQVGMCCRLHASYFANVQKSDSQHVHFPFFFLFFFTLTLCKTLRSSGQKVYVQNTFRVIAEAVVTWRRSEETTNTGFASSQVKNKHRCRPVFLQIHIFLRVTVLYIPFTLHSPSRLTLVCVKWIRPGNVFLTVSDRLSLSQLQAGKTCAVFTKGLPLRLESLDWAATSQIYR